MIIRSPRELALFIKEQRKRLNLNQAAVGDRVGIKQQTISSFENKPENTLLDTLFHILSAVELDIWIAPKDKNLVGQAPNKKSEW